jgi:hypothetical protein
MEIEVEALQHDRRLPLCLYMLGRITGSELVSLYGHPPLDGPDT